MASQRRIMLLGANGQVGQALRAQYLPDGWELGAYGHAEVDIARHGDVQKAMHDFRPDIIVNSAAMTNVDAAEKDTARALALNFDAVANLAAQASVMDVPVIHLSTDYVFDGRDGDVPYKTEDKVNPLSVYGDTKLMGEEALRHELHWHVILRVSAVFSEFGNNLLTSILSIIDEKDELQGVVDQIACPTYAPEIAKAVFTIAASIFKGKPDGFGTFHLCGSPAGSRLEFVQAIMDAYAPYTAKRPKIVPVSLKDTDPERAERPGYSVLDCGKIRTVYGIEQKDWRDGLTTAMAFLMRERRKTA